MGHGDDSKKVVLGKIGKVHGIKGWLRLNSFTAPPENILDYPQLSATIGQNVQVLEVDDSKQQPNGLLVHFTGYDVPETARVLTGLEVWVDSKRQFTPKGVDHPITVYRLSGIGGRYQLSLERNVPEISSFSA